MKKVFLSMLALICSLSLMATQTAYVQIDLVGTSYPAFSTASLYLMEDTERSAAYESGYDSQDAGTLSNNYSVLLYGLVGATKCSFVATDDLTGLYIGFTTNNVDTEYKLVFSDFEGAEFTLYDLVENQAILVNASTPDYEFTAASGQVEINDRFIINYVPAPVYAAEVTTNADGLATFSYASDLEAVEAVNLYKGDLDGETLVLSQVDYVKGGEGVIVYGAANTTYHFNAGTGTSDFAGNELIASENWDYASNSGYNIYVLSGNMLYLYEGTAMKPNKAFLKVDQNPLAGPAPKRISFRFNEPTGIENTNAVLKAEKFIGEDGQILIKRGNEVFNLQGQIVK